MQTPKLELYISILKLLDDRDELSFYEIATIITVEKKLLQGCIRFLVEQGMISKTNNNKELICRITANGNKVLAFFRCCRDPKKFSAMKTRN